MGIKAAFMKVIPFLLDVIIIDLNFGLSLRFCVLFVIHAVAFALTSLHYIYIVKVFVVSLIFWFCGFVSKCSGVGS